MKKTALKLMCLVLVLLFMLSGCGNGEYKIKDKNLKAGSAVQDNNRVFYQIFVGSFSDSNGDGTGDLRGIINRFDYLNDGKPNSGKSLGVGGIWLTPIFKSPSYHKYNVDDYYQIDPLFGTEEDLKELIALCRERDVKLILDLPINHTSTSNAWFQNFKSAHLNGNSSDEYYDFYSYCLKTDTVPAGRTFSPIAGTNIRYECNFDGSMPELNYDSPAVRSAVLDIAKHYLNLGIDGFRFDAAMYIYYGDNTSSAAFWDWYIGELKGIKEDIYTVAEIWSSDSVTDYYYSATNCFDFTMSQANGLIATAAKGGNVNTYTAYVEKYLNRVKALNANATIVPFIANHDTDRAAGYLTVSSGQMQVAANLYLLSPGSPFIYYGEEIGMKGSRGSDNTDANRRLAMLWGDDDTVKNPIGSTYDSTKQTNGTVADQIGDENSLYNYYKKLLMIRNANPEIASGEYKALRFSDTKLGGFTSTYGGSTVAVLHNTTTEAITVDLAEVTDLHFSEIRAFIGMNGVTLEGTILTLGAQTSVVLK